MICYSHLVMCQEGLHARPAGQLVKLASTFQSDITIYFGGKHADAKKILSVMSLCAKQGDLIEVAIQGVDEPEAAHAIQQLLQEQL